MKYGVVIVTYNRQVLLKECLEHVSNQTLAFERIVVVNNCSTDGTKDILKDYESDPRFIIKHEDTNHGGAGGFKIGLEIASKELLDWILIIDDDAIIDYNYVEVCNNYLEANKSKKILACSGTVKTNDKIQPIHRRRLTNKILHLEANVSLDEYNNESFSCDLVTFCGLMIRKKLVDKIGLPKAEYFIWYDDTEYCMRINKYCKITNINKAIINHKTVESVITEGFFSRMSWRSYYGHRNRLDAVKNHCGIATKMVVYIQYIIFLLCGYFMQLSKKKREQGKYVVKMLKAAYRDGSRGHLGKNNEFFPGK